MVERRPHPPMLLYGDCLELMGDLPDESVDVVCTDPPYGYSFMGKHWDHEVPGPAYWREALRVLRPGGHLAAFGGARTYHRLASAIEDAGFEIRDQLLWLYGSGMPKSYNIAKAIDRRAGATRPVIGRYQPPGMSGAWNLRNARDERDVAIFASSRNNLEITGPATALAREWEGWGTALKPAHEPIVLARKPFRGTVTDNVIGIGLGALHIAPCRVPAAGAGQGRWPANVLHDGSREVSRALAPGRGKGGPERFFYCAKASRAERNAGLERAPKRALNWSKGVKNPGSFQHPGTEREVANHHPSVKPVALMRWLVRLLSPPGGRVLDPFMGSGSTGCAAVLEGASFIGIEKDEGYINLAAERVAHYAAAARCQSREDVRHR